MKPLPLTILISFLLFSNLAFAEQEAFDPFPQNRGTVYEYSDEELDEIDVCFFPIDKSRWDGSKITAKEWQMLTDFQKTMFICEYVEQLEKEYNTTIEINGWDYLIALNGFAANCEDECLKEPMTRVIRELLIKQGVLK